MVVLIVGLLGVIVLSPADTGTAAAALLATAFLMGDSAQIPSGCYGPPVGHRGRPVREECTALRAPIRVARPSAVTNSAEGAPSGWCCRWQA